MNFENIKEYISEKITINNVVWYYLKWEKLNWEHKYKCPFHANWQENTPSFSVSDSKNFYKCFWCGKFWDIISFVMNYKNLPYISALEELNDVFELWLNLEKNNDKDFLKRNLIYSFHDKINERMVSFLEESEEIKEYLLTKRQLTEETIKNFWIWYSRNREISDFAIELYNTEEYKWKFKLRDTGLYTFKEETNKNYFLFANRIMYPIRNIRWKIIWWSGWKTQEEQEPKYINSVNNFIYDKSRNLFNIDKVDFNNNDTLIICEWNLDSTQIYNFWWNNAISLLWTNLTENQINLFKDKITRVILALDNDEAGWKGIYKNAKLLLNNWIIPYIISLGDSKDVDDFLKNKKSFFKENNVSEYFENHKVELLKWFLIDNYIVNREKYDLETRYFILTKIKDIYSSINDDVLRNVYKEELSKNWIIFENLEKEYQEKNKQKNKIIIEKKEENKKLNDIWLNLIYLIKTWDLEEEIIEWFNLLYLMNLKRREEYKLSLEDFKIKFSEEINLFSNDVNNLLKQI